MISHCCSLNSFRGRPELGRQPPRPFGFLFSFFILSPLYLYYDNNNIFLKKVKQMYAYKEYLLTGICPFCKNAINYIINSIDEDFILTCSCKSRLRITPIKLSNIFIIEKGTKYQTVGAIFLKTRDCCQ